ncbi:MAG: polyphosphate kinase 1 [Ignavibacteriae bacterium]|nr:polyphosphate kinase 1 [Ignavibacteriota bacterium]
MYAKQQDAAYDAVLPGEADHEGIRVVAEQGIQAVNLYDSSLYFNRELSWIDFNTRVLNEALDPDVPLLERLKFLAITSSNLDEFFMIRVAGLQDQLALGVPDVPPDGMTPEETLDEIHSRVTRMMKAMSDCFLRDIVPGLEAENVFIHSREQLDEHARHWCEQYFYDDVFPVLTPLAIDPGHPFPHLLNRSLNLLMTIGDPVTGDERIAVVQVPPIISRLVSIPTYKKGEHFVLLGEIIAANADALFPGLQVKQWHRFRVTRNADLEIADDEASDLLKTIEEQVRRRRWGAVVRLEVDHRMPKKQRKLLMRAMHVAERDVYTIEGPMNLADFMDLIKLPKRHLKDRTHAPRPVPQLRNDPNIFDAIKARDIFLHHPYDSFTPVVEFIEEAADDPRVLAIKQTLYRAGGGESAIVKALARAAENGKQVTAFVELKARFDEENNIIWARALEHAGVHVVYGIMGLKTHCKVAIVVRKEKKGLRTYAHFSTGNYNESTAKLYTDFGLLTCREDIGYEASGLFNYLTGYSHQSEWNKIVVAPISMRQKLLGLIQREAEKQREGGRGRIIAKLNALVDSQIIRALYRASQAGVSIDLAVRGICCLRPGLPGVSENIRVRSIIGRFLEHSRVFVFGEDNECEVYISSADWMPRNLNRRVEVMTRVEDEDVVRRILESILPPYLDPRTEAYELLEDGSYVLSVPREGAPLNVMEHFIKITDAAYRAAKSNGRDDDTDE